MKTIDPVVAEILDMIKEQITIERNVMADAIKVNDKNKISIAVTRALTLSAVQSAIYDLLIIHGGK